MVFQIDVLLPELEIKLTGGWGPGWFPDEKKEFGFRDSKPKGRHCDLAKAMKFS
jgi:hypothetical protein